MKRLLAAIGVVLPSLAGAEEDPLDRVRKAIDALGAKPGHAVFADWKLEGEDYKTDPPRGTVQSVVRQKDQFMRLFAKFKDGDTTVYKRGATIAVEDPQTKEWGPASDDARAKFVVRLFDLPGFLTDAHGMAVSARWAKATTDGCLRVEFEAEADKLAKLLAEAEAGKALTSGTLEKATMKVALEVSRGTSEPQLLIVEIEGDSKTAAVKPPPDDNGGFKPWEPGEADPEPGKKEEPKKEEEKKPEPQPEAVVKRIKVILTAKSNYNAGLEVEVPEGAKKVLGMK